MKYVFGFKPISRSGRYTSFTKLWGNDASLCISKQIKGRSRGNMNSNMFVQGEKQAKPLQIA